RRHSFHAPMLRMFRYLFVHSRQVLDGPTHQLVHKLVVAGVLLRVERLVIGLNRIPHRLPPRIPQKQDLQRALTGSASRRHYAPWRGARSRFAISMAVSAASAPLLPLLAPARSRACSNVLVVSTPKATGVPVSAETWAMPLAASPAT